MQCHFLNRHLNLSSEWVGVDLRTDTKKNVLKLYQTTFSKFINCSRHIFNILGGLMLSFQSSKNSQGWTRKTCKSMRPDYVLTLQTPCQVHILTQLGAKPRFFTLTYLYINFCISFPILLSLEMTMICLISLLLAE